MHPSTHPASIIVQDASNRFVTDAEKAAWNAKASTAAVTTTANGLMIFTDKVKLDNCSYEYGSNTNGYYKKYGDGTLHMWGSFTPTIAETTGRNTSGNIFWSSPLTISFPILATVAPICNMTIECGSLIAWSTITASTRSDITYIVVSTGNYTDFKPRVNWAAFGRWK